MTAGNNTHCSPDYIAASITLIVRSLARTHVEFGLHHPVIALAELRLNGQILSLFVRAAQSMMRFLRCSPNDRGLCGSNQSEFCARAIFISGGITRSYCSGQVHKFCEIRAKLG
jgi:hypothetical protein